MLIFKKSLLFDEITGSDHVLCKMAGPGQPRPRIQCFPNACERSTPASFQSGKYGGWLTAFLGEMHSWIYLLY